MFPPELEPGFRANNGEFGWAREQIPLVVDILRRRSLAILGGELWWVFDGGVRGLVPQRQGPPAIYPWKRPVIQESHGPSLLRGVLTIRLPPFHTGLRQRTCHTIWKGGSFTISPGFPKRSSKISVSPYRSAFPKRVFCDFPHSENRVSQALATFAVELPLFRQTVP